MASTSVVFDVLARDRASGTFDKFGRSVDGSTSKMSKFNGLMKTAGKAAAYGIGAGLVIAAGAGVKFAKAAAEDAQAAELLKGALERNAGATKKQVADVEDWITAIGRAKGVADDDLRPALSRLVTATHDVGKAQLLAQYAMDVSAGTGKSLESVSTALMKAQNGQVSSLSRLGINTKNAKGETIGMKEAVERMGEQFGGAASAKAETFQGKMDRLKLMLSETGETIGYKLIPVATKLMDWITGTAIPAVEGFVGEWEKGVGTGGKVRDILEKVGSAVKNVATFLWDHKRAVAGVVAAYLLYRGVLVGIAVQQAVSLALLKAHTVGTVQHTVVSKVAAAASKTWAGAQWLLNAALSANPIGLAIAAVALLAAGLVVAYKKSETFRNIVKDAIDVVGDAFRWFWNNVGQPVIKFFVSGLADIIEMFADLIGGMSHIPGFGWLKPLAAGMHVAADRTKELADNIRDIPSRTTVTIDVLVNTSAMDKVDHWLATHGGHDVGRRAPGSNPGAAFIESIIKGIDKGKVLLDRALEQVRTFIQRHQDRLTGLLDKRAGVIDSFKGMTSSIFSTDLSVGEGEAPATIQKLLDFGKQMRTNAEALAANVRGLRTKGLSKDLINQLLGAGEAGQAQIALLAGGSAEQIAQANADNAAKQAALVAAGMTAAGGLGINADIRQEQRDIRLAKTIRAELTEWRKQDDRNTTLSVKLSGNDLLLLINRSLRQDGKPPIP